MINFDWIQQLDHARISNLSNLVPALQDVAFDEGRQYSLPWQSGMTGIGFNPSAVGKEITSINDLFDPALAGRVTMLATTPPAMSTSAGSTRAGCARISSPRIARPRGSH